MKQLLPAFALVLMMFSSARADFISVYGETDGLECYKAWTPGVPATVYVIHKAGIEQRSGTAFKILDNTGFVQAGWSAGALLGIGDPYNIGLQVAYGECRSFDTVVASLAFIGFTAPTSCDQGLRVVGHDFFGSEPVASLCGPPPQTIVAITGGRFSFYAVCGFCGEFVATEPSTWGKVKALYRK
jgi:hypothetical protein